MDRGTDVGVPWIQGDPPIYTGAFRDNVRVFLKDYGTPVVDLGLPLVSCWNVELRSQQSSVQLQVYEERLNDHLPSYCDPCRIIGWQHHAVCTRRYHFIMPARLDAETAREHANLPALVALGLAATSGKLLALPSGPTSDDCTASYTAPASVFDSQTHLLHGVLHANGFGHLLRINGLEGGSSALTGRQTMTMWDRLCELLRAREVSVEDVSNKAGMELRVLHMSAYRNTWYGRWGYAFGRGGFGISRATWRRAADAVHKTLLADVLEDFQGSDPALTHIVDRYSAPMGGSKKVLMTLGELLQRLLHLLSHADEAAPLLESRGMPPPLRAAPAGTKTPAPPKRKQPPSGKSSSKKRPAPSRATGSTPAAKRAATDREPPPEVPQALLAAELRPSPILLEPLEGRWWKKRWSGDRAQSALAAALSALQKRRGLWTSASRLRKAMRPRVAETSLLEFVIGTMANRSVNGANISMDMHPSSPEEYFLLDMCGADDMDILQQNSDREQDSMDAEHQRIAAEAPAEAGEAVTDTGPDENGLASEAGSGKMEVEAGSNAETHAPLEKAEAANGVPPVEAVVKDEPRGSEPAAAPDEPMPGPSPGNLCGTADTVVQGLAACSKAEPAGASSAVKDEQGQASAAPSLPPTNANATERQETLPESEAAQSPQAANPGPSIAASISAELGTAAADEPQPQEQPEVKVEIAPIPAGSKQPRLPNGRFLPKNNQRPESAPATWSRDTGRDGPSMGTTAAIHENGASGPLQPDDAAQEPLPMTDQEIPVTQESGEGRKRHSMPALACQLPSRRSMRGVKAQHGETHGLEDRNGTRLESKAADSAAPAPVESMSLVSNKDSQPAAEIPANAQPDSGYCPDSGPSHSTMPVENGVEQLRQWGHRGVRNPRTSSPTRPPKAANGHKGQDHSDDAAPPVAVLATPVRDFSPAKEQNGATPVTPDMGGAMPAACTRPRSRLGKAKADPKAAGASASAPAAHGWAKKAAHLNKELTSLDSLGRSKDQSDVSASRLRHTPQVNYSEKKRRDNLKLEAALKRQRISYTASSAAEGPPSRWFPWQRLTPGARFTPQAGLTVRDQVMCDLAYLFNVIMRTYRPAAAAAAAAAAGNIEKAQGEAVSACDPSTPCDCSLEHSTAGLPHLRLATLPADVQVLRDVKHFVKDYQGDKLHPSAVPGDTSGSPQGEMRLLVRVQVPERTTAGPSLNSARANSSVQSMSPGRVQKQGGRGAGRGGRGGPRRRPMRKRAMLGPPPELLLLSAKSTIPQLRKAAAVAVSDTYRMFERFEVKRIEGLEAGAQQRGRLGPLTDGTVLTLHGDGIDLDPFWRHAGGVEEWQVACCCGTRDDDGERMIACDGCAEWSHTRCAGFADALPSPDHFLCPRCSRLPPTQRPLALETPQVT